MSKRRQNIILLILPTISLFLPILLASIKNGSILELYKTGCIISMNFISQVMVFIMKDIKCFCEIVYNNIYGLLRCMVCIHILSMLVSKSNLIEKIMSLYYSNTIAKRCTTYIGNIKFLHKPCDQIMQLIIIPIYSSNKNLLLWMNRCVVNIVKCVTVLFDDEEDDDENLVLKQFLYNNNSNHSCSSKNNNDSRCYICKKPSPKIHTFCCSIAVHVECMNECLKNTKSSCVVCSSVLKLKYDGDKGCHAA